MSPFAAAIERSTLIDSCEATGAYTLFGSKSRPGNWRSPGTHHRALCINDFPSVPIGFNRNTQVKGSGLGASVAGTYFHFSRSRRARWSRSMASHHRNCLIASLNDFESLESLKVF